MAEAEPPRCAAQNLSAGIILAAVASELFPLLGKAKGAKAGLGLALGFAAGLATVFGVDHIAFKFEARRAGGRALSGLTPGAAQAKRAGEEGEVNKDEEATELLDVTHKAHIKGHIDELAAAIALVDERASRLLAPTTAAVEEEELSEQIDEELHKVMYKLDHCRRLLEGSETGAPRAMPAEEKAALRTKVSELKAALAHLQSHMDAPSLDRSTVKEVHDHFDDLEGMLQSFHSMSSATFSYWRRGDANRHPLGAALPWSLIIPVVIDSFVDGFLIGLSCSLSHHAGLVLAFATCIEMTFLGAAFAATVARCTGASRAARLATVVTPPVVLLVAAVIGAARGDISASSPAAFTAFVAFGVVALLFLVTHELLIEAHDAQGGKEVWWINVVLFVGVFIVLLLNRVLPEG